MHASRIRLQYAQRIISIPITRPSSSTAPLRPGNSKLDHSKIITYYRFQINNPHKPKGGDGSTGTSRNWVKWAQDKAAATWSSFGKAPEGSWKLKVFRTGERIVDRIDFEELALHGVDPALGPTVLHPDISGKGEEKEEEKLKAKLVIPLLYPSSVYSSEASLEHLRQLLSSRTPRHQRGMWMWIILAPFTAPFMVVPILPNLPFFFCVWRSWSHYKAYRASKYLSTLIDKQIIVPEPSEVLDTIYQSTSSSSESGASTVELLFSREKVPTIVSAFKLPESATTDIYRAIEQANIRFSKS